MELKGIRRILDIYENKTKTMEEQTKLLNQVYSKVLSFVKSDDDYETIKLIQPILDKIDQIQNELNN